MIINPGPAAPPPRSGKAGVPLVDQESIASSENMELHRITGSKRRRM